MYIKIIQNTIISINPIIFSILNLKGGIKTTIDEIIKPSIQLYKISYLLFIKYDNILINISKPNKAPIIKGI